MSQDSGRAIDAGMRAAALALIMSAGSVAGQDHPGQGMIYAPETMAAIYYTCVLQSEGRIWCRLERATVRGNEDEAGSTVCAVEAKSWDREFTQNLPGSWIVAEQVPNPCGIVEADRWMRVADGFDGWAFIEQKTVTNREAEESCSWYDEEAHQYLPAYREHPVNCEVIRFGRFLPFTVPPLDD